MEGKTAKNRTPDKLPASEKEALFTLCDRHLRLTLEILRPKFVIGVGVFARERAEAVSEGLSFKVTVGQILHPSPASPLANHNWKEKIEKEMQELGVTL